jgi:UDP-3-O-[3-hydroxymyristoyl] glucosamine N-acyltransferase
VGDASCTITGIAPLESAGPADVSYFTDSKFASQLDASGAAAVIVRQESDAAGRIALVASEPYLALRGAILAFHRVHPEIIPGIAESAVVAEDAHVDPAAQICALAVVETGARVEAGAYVGAGCYVGRESKVGSDSYLYPNTTLYHGVDLGQRVIVHSGVVLGADGFGYAESDKGALKVPQVGGVVVEDDVEIGANTTIDRATLGVTRIGKGTKIDNLVMIGHNVQIGEHCILVSQVGIAGSTRVGKGVVMAGQVGVADHLDIGDGVVIAAQSGVPGNLRAGKTYLGSPAREVSDAKRIYAYMSKLPEWARRIRALEQQLTGQT